MSEVALRIRDVSAHELEQATTDLPEVDFKESLSNMDAVTGAVIVASLVAGAKVLIRLWREFRGGTVLDLTKTPPDVHRDRDLDWGFFMIVAKDGSVTVEAKDEPKDSLERMAESLLKLATTATVDLAKAAVQSALGDKAKVKTEPAPA